MLSIINIKMDKETHNLVDKIEICKQAERYDQIINLFKELVNLRKSLNKEQRHLFSAAYKKVVGKHMSEWKIIRNIEKK